MTASFQPLADLLPQALLLVTIDGTVAAVNSAACVLLGRAATDLVQQPLQAFCHGDEPSVAALIRTSARSTTPRPDNLTLLIADGRALACRCEGAMYRDAGGEACALVLLRLLPRMEALSQFSQLNQRIAMLSREIARRRATEVELLATTERLEQADRRKDEFLSMLAHELRNPLAPLRMGIQLLERKHGALPDVVKLTRMMARQTDHMVRMVDDLLDVARLTRGTIDLRMEQFALTDAIDQAVEMRRPALEARGLSLTLEVTAKEPYIHGDLTRMVQVFANLLTNAGKFTESGGRVTVRCWSEGEAVIVSVQDTGVGIPADLLPHVFDLFVQGDRSLDRSQGGLGVGLTIVQSIVQQHGGAVHATSAGRGCGSLFEVRLPRSTQSAPASAPVSAPAVEAAGPLRVLVVDDNVEATQTLCSLVESWGHQVEGVYDANAALGRIDGFDPQVLLMDIGLPGMNGYELAGIARRRPQGKALLLIAITGYGDVAARQRSAECGIDQHLTKPVEPDTLEQILSDHASRRVGRPPR